MIMCFFFKYVIYICYKWTFKSLILLSLIYIDLYNSWWKNIFQCNLLNSVVNVNHNFNITMKNSNQNPTNNWLLVDVFLAEVKNQILLKIWCESCNLYLKYRVITTKEVFNWIYLVWIVIYHDSERKKFFFFFY